MSSSRCYGWVSTSYVAAASSRRVVTALSGLGRVGMVTSLAARLGTQPARPLALLARMHSPRPRRMFNNQCEKSVAESATPDHRDQLRRGSAVGTKPWNRPNAVASNDHESDTWSLASLKSNWMRRYTIIALCFAAFMLCNLDRVNMSIAIIPMSHEFNWSLSTMGIVQSSFFIGYLLTQILGGFAADRWNGKAVLAIGVVWWSLATVVTPITAHAGIQLLCFSRFFMGVGEGVALPAMNNMLSRWVPSQERSRSLAIVYSGQFIGSAIGLGVSPFIIKALGWPSVFYLFGSLGFAWFFVWQKRASSSPDVDTRISSSERSFLLRTVEAGQGESATRIPWKKLLSRKEVWAIIVCHFCHGTFILLTWMPTYYHDVLHLNLANSGIVSVVPWLTMAVSANFAAYIADVICLPRIGRTRTRKLMQTIGFLGPALCLSVLPYISMPAQAVGLLSLSQGLDAFSHSGLYSNHQDIGPKYAGVLVGMSNTAGCLAGVLGTATTGRILETGSWNMVWGGAVCFYLIGTAVWLTCSTGKRIFD